jgi:hypothetical protein
VNAPLTSQLAEFHALERSSFEIAEMNGGEFDPQLEAYLAQMHVDIERKVDSYRFITDRFDASIEAIDKDIKKLTRIKKGLTSASQRILDRLKFIMLEHGYDELRGVNWRYLLSRSAPAVTYDVANIPDEYIDIVTTRVPKEQAIKAAIKAGQTIPGVTVREVRSLRSYANKKD